MTKDLKQEAKAFVVLAFRNGPIEEVHAGTRCPTCADQAVYSKITDAEMKTIIKSAVDQVYWLLSLKRDNPAEYARQLSYGERCAIGWDNPVSRSPRGKRRDA
jgi:hypothetical protein